MGMVAAVEGTFIDMDMEAGELMARLWVVLIAIGGFWSSIDMEGSCILCRTWSEDTPYPGGLVRDGESRE
jgi:hypothetical protein